MKNEDIYLGNGCLYALLANNILSFNGSKTTTTQVVGIEEYTHLKGGILLANEWKQTDDVDFETQKVEVSLKNSETCIVLCNAQNQIESYIQFENNNGILKFKVIAEECYCTNEFQGSIGNKTVSEKKFRKYIKNATN